MAVIVPTKIDLPKGLILNTKCIPAHRFDAAFDSYLLLKDNGCDNHTLTLVLKIFLNPIAPPLGLPLFPHLDHDKTGFWITPWRAGEWQKFQNSFKQQALKWTNRFWLVPPAGFSRLDVKVGSRTLRPNIYCHLYIDIVGGPGGAHHAIDVVNLHKGLTAAQQGVQPRDLSSSTFRSNSGQYDSLDVNGTSHRWTDAAGQARQSVNFLTIVHEIGHALGLPHIGVSHGDPLCQAAILMGDTIVGDLAFGALFKGKSNSHACYGTRLPPSRGANVMGYGTQFDHTNAQPWTERIALHTGTDKKDWTVSLKKVAPKFL